ncbi:MAG: hypothetical protein CK532_02900 [Flavobacteriales bacterium]|nr:MAG: hypothetical protein CK532_02900 [Flavobacteriales bacterium]
MEPISNNLCAMLKPKAFFTVDVEEWYHALVVEKYIPRKIWPAQESRLPACIDIILALLSKHNTSATFFCLSSIPKQNHTVLRKISDAGHEIASHGVSHKKLHLLSDKELWSELSSSKDTLEAITGQEVIGFRAPNFSIEDRAIIALKETGYRYDSSLLSVNWHPHYGTLRGEQVGQDPCVLSNGIWEFPLSKYRVLGLDIPWCGGAYARHMPFSAFQLGMQQFSKKYAYNFYVHPWEVDPNPLAIKAMNPLDRIRHFRNIEKMPSRIDKLLNLASFSTIKQYIHEQSNN